jgi:hypothetical protein
MSSTVIIPNHRFNDLVGAMGKNFTTEQLLDAIVGSGNKQLLRIFTTAQPPATKNLKPGQVRCTAYKFQVTLNEETGEFEPVQCDHACVSGANHCGQHERHSTRNKDATWKILGDLETGPGDTFTDTNHPNYNEVRSNYYKSRGMVPPTNTSKQSTQPSKTKSSASVSKSEPKKQKAAVAAATKTATKTEKKAKQPKERKPTVNPFLNFLSKNRGTIRTECLAADESISGRDLQTAITVRAGEMWRSLGDDEKAVYKTVVAIAVAKSGVELIEEECDSEASTPKAATPVALPDPEPQADAEDAEEEVAEDAEDAEEEEEENSFVFHEKLKVFYDPMTSCYSAEKNTPVIGTIKSGKLVPFKR